MTKTPDQITPNKKPSVKRVFIGPANIAGIASRLAESLTQLGFDAQSILAWPDKFQYSQTTSSVLKMWQWVGAKRQATSGNIPKKAFFVLSHIFIGFCLLPWALVKFDAFIFLFAQTITNSTFELQLLKLFKKRIIFVYVGSDVRPAYMDGGRFPEGVPIPNGKILRKITLGRKKLLTRHEKYADFIINSPTCAQFHEKPYINWFSIGIPTNTKHESQIAALEACTQDQVVRILHSPSSAAVKGTRYILAMLDKLKAQGLHFELVLLQDMTNDQVIDEIKRCDFVIDQLFSDTPLAVFATEAALFGKPAVVGGYSVKSSDIPFAKYGHPPSLFVHPDDMISAIEKLITDSPLRQQLGAAAAKFVRTHWSATEVANRYSQLLTDSPDPDWWIDPYATNYALGCGLERHRTAALTATLINEFGEESLCVNDKPILLDQLKIIATAETRKPNA